MKKINLTVFFLFLFALPVFIYDPSVLFASSTSQEKVDLTALEMPKPGDYALHILAPDLLELVLITTKDADPAPLTQWSFIDASGNGSLPSPSAFSVSANGQSIGVQSVGFKRRPLYAPLRVRDLRIANYLYLKLSSSITPGATVRVTNPSQNLWLDTKPFIATFDPYRYSPAIHSNQVGYIPTMPKKAMVGYYLGSMGEMNLTALGITTFSLIDAGTNSVVYSGNLTVRKDAVFSAYQNIGEADFTGFNTPGEYRLMVPGLGVSLPFRIDNGVAATFTRTYALGIYHQRCGTDNALPFTRFTHGACHINPAAIPTMASPDFDIVNNTLAIDSADYAANPRHTAPQLSSVAASLYPFVKSGTVDVSGGHHDAGDYSKYTHNVAYLIHYLIFAVDAFPGVKDLDNLGLPESGDGISDVMQEAKWEADFLAKMQDDDGGFYFLVYPRNRSYELDVLPDHGDPQAVFPKTTGVTAAAVGALAEIASSPTFKAAYPTEAAAYLAKAVKGWEFLERAIAAHGRDGSYQKITHYGDVFIHDDELAYAAAALYAATGEAKYDTDLRTHTPHPNSTSVRRWSWWGMFEGYGCAFRTYAFAAQTGRLSADKLDPAYLAKCRAEIAYAADYALLSSNHNAYGSSFSDDGKGIMAAGWYFSGEQAFDLAVGYLLNPQPAYLDAILKNYNYEMGCNPVSVSYLTGTGWKRQREIVHQYALNDRRVLPPSGIPLGNMQSGFAWLETYRSELTALTYPSDGAYTSPYPLYDRWGDSFNVATEFVVPSEARSLTAAAFLMSMGPFKTQAWRSTIAQITGLPVVRSQVNQPVTATLTVDYPGLDLSNARIVWEARDQEPSFGPAFTFSPLYSGAQWIEAEAQLPDGRRVFAASNFDTYAVVNNTIEQYQTTPLSNNTEVKAWYPLDGNYADRKGLQLALTPEGNIAFDNISFSWPNRPAGQALRVQALGDRAYVTIADTAALFAGTTPGYLSIEAMIYVENFKAYGQANVNLFSLEKNWNAFLKLYDGMWGGSGFIRQPNNGLFTGEEFLNTLTKNCWHHVKMTIDTAGYKVAIDGTTVANSDSTDLATWLYPGSAILEIGNFEGWIDEVVIKASGSSSPAGYTLTVSAANGTVTKSPDQPTYTANTTVQLTATPNSGYRFESWSGDVTGTTNPVTMVMDANKSVSANFVAVASSGTDYRGSSALVNQDTVAVYHLDGNYNDAAGRQPNLIPAGAAAFDTSNVRWMTTPAGAALRVSDLGDKLTVTLPNVELYKSGVTQAIAIEALVYVNAYKAYSRGNALLISLNERWDLQLKTSQDMWANSPYVVGGPERIVVNAATLAQALKINCWQKVTILLDQAGYHVKVNDAEIAQLVSSDLANWGGIRSASLEFGNFDGWVDEIVVKSISSVHSTVIYGDASGDGQVSAYDAALCSRIAVGLDPLGDKLTVADVNGDGVVSAYDAALIAQRAVGLITKFPVEP